jgi:hypothetical protein
MIKKASASPTEHTTTTAATSASATHRSWTRQRASIISVSD